MSLQNRPVSDLPTLLRTMTPVLNPSVHVYCVLPVGVTPIPAPLAIFHEPEGVTLIVPETQAIRENWPILFRAAWITLNVPSDLQAIGLTAAVSQALAEADIDCKVVAAGYHDHLFVPVAHAEAAMTHLQWLREHAG